MKTRWLACTLVLTGIGLVIAASPAAATPPDTAANCIRVAPEARYRGLGYNHIVHLTNVCKSSAECDVSTDVNPDAQHVTVAAGEHIEVTTFMGSPARVFVPKVECKMGSK
jgi:hypothetical protein